MYVENSEYQNAWMILKVSCIKLCLLHLNVFHCSSKCLILVIINIHDPTQATNSYDMFLYFLVSE